MKNKFLQKYCRTELYIMLSYIIYVIFFNVYVLTDSSYKANKKIFTVQQSRIEVYTLRQQFNKNRKRILIINRTHISSYLFIKLYLFIFVNYKTQTIKFLTSFHKKLLLFNVSVKFATKILNLLVI